MPDSLVRKSVHLWVLLLLALPLVSLSQNPFRPAVPPAGNAWADGSPLPHQVQAWHLDRDLLLYLLRETPYRFEHPQRPGMTLVLPDARGVSRRYLVWSSPVMAQGLAARFPEIHTWFGVDAEHPARRLLLDLGPKGLHAMITCPGEPDQFLDPWDRHHGTGPLIAYSKNELPVTGQGSFRCLTLSSAEAYPEEPDNRSLATDNHLRTYRLALACTGEYGTFHGGSIASVLAAMVTTMHRVNGIYERDFGIRMELVEDNDLLIFLHPATDPFDNGDIGSLLPANQQLCDNVIGSPNYDIGHVFGTAGGGLATLFGPCNANTKARAATGLSNPAGDPFDVDYAAHEIGHQFGGNHTFNNSCSGNRNNATAWEPGSGSTIMAYAGICDPNVQSFSDAYFHGGTQAEIRQFSVNGNGNTCPQLFPSGNQAPQVDAGPDRVIPHSTPFELSAIGWDPDGDTLSYTWEQFNPQIGPMPPMAGNTQGPLFRSLPPNLSPLRVFPALPAILQNQSPNWEALPAVARTLQFRVTVRDNHPLHGRWAQDALQLTVNGASGPFRVTHPNEAIMWVVGDTVTVTWDVAGTDLPPVNSPQVEIRLSTDGGYSFPITLGQALPNTGQASLLVPWTLSDLCRVRVQGHDHIFFDISDADFTIREPDQPSFLAKGAPDSLSLCRNAGDTSSLFIAIQPLGGMADTLHLSWSGPQGLVSDLPDRFYLSQTDTIPFRIWFGADPSPDQAPLEVLLQSGSQERRLRFGLSHFSRPLDSPDLIAPEEGLDSLALDLALQWSPVAGATLYLLELASGPGFGPTTFLQIETPDTTHLLNLPAGQICYWRVRAGNPCGYADPSKARVFRTLAEECQTLSPADLPVVIPEGGIFATNSIVEVADSGQISRVEADIQLTHSNLGQITLRLSDPSGQSRNLVFKACPGQQDIQARFSDLGQPIFCSGLPPAISGLVRAQGGPMDLFAGRPAAGTWTLRIIDDQFFTGGILHHWALRWCTSPPVARFPAWPADTLPVPYLGDRLLDRPEGLDEASLRILLRQPPQQGWLERQGSPLQTGDLLAGTQIANGEVRYRHGGGAVLLDEIIFDVLDTISGAWEPGLTLPVRIVPGLQGDILQEQPISCAGDADGQLAVNVRNGQWPFEYRQYPSGDWQSDSLFMDLGPGEYRFEARDNNDFLVVTASFLLTDPDTLLLNGAQTGEDQVLLEASGGRPPYRFRLEEADWQNHPVFEGLPAGTHIFCVADSSDCLACTLVEIQVSSLIGVSSALDGVVVFPNPTGDWLHVRLDETAEGPFHWRIRDALGRRVQEGANAGRFWSLPVVHLPAGWYLLEIHGQRGTAAIKIRVATGR